MSEMQNDPLLPGFSFNAHLVAGVTPIEEKGLLDFVIYRMEGMKGYVLNRTMRGEGIIHSQDGEYLCKPGDILLFATGVPHHYHRAPHSKEWYHQWVYFRPRSFWQELLHWDPLFQKIGFYRPDDKQQEMFSQMLEQIIAASKREGRYAELLAINLLEQFLLCRMEILSAAEPPRLDHRIRAACRYITDHIADRDFDIASVANHVCLSPSRLSHLFRQQIGVNILSWREDLRINQAKILLGTTLMPIASVARKMGFDDQLYFSRVFKKCTGISPSEFRTTGL